MIAKITTLELDLKKFPIEINAYNGKQLVKKWEFNSENEAKEAQKGIWAEIFKAKIGGANETKAVSN